MDAPSSAHRPKHGEAGAGGGGEGRGGGDEQNVNEREEVEMAEGGAGGGGAKRLASAELKHVQKWENSKQVLHSCTSLVILLHILMYDNNSIYCVIIV